MSFYVLKKPNGQIIRLPNSELIIKTIKEQNFIYENKHIISEDGETDMVKNYEISDCELEDILIEIRKLKQFIL